MTGKSPQTSLTKPQSKRAPKSRNGSAQAGASLEAASVAAVLALGFASTTKPAKGKKPAHNQGDAGVASGVAVPVTSKPQSEGFAAKQMPDDPAWVALLHDLGTMSTMALRAKYSGEANTHRNMLQRVKTCGAVDAVPRRGVGSCGGGHRRCFVSNCICLVAEINLDRRFHR